MRALEVFFFCLVASASAAPHIAVGPASTVLSGSLGVAGAYATHGLGYASHGIATQAVGVAGPAIATQAVGYAAAPAIASHVGIAAAPVVATHAVGVAAAPAIATHAIGVSAPVVSHRTDIAHVPTTAVVDAPTVVQGSVLSKNVHYANQPVVTGYTSSVIKPNLGSIATPLHTVSQQRVAAVGRPVQTIVPHVTQVQPEVHVQRVAVDVPVQTPVVSEVEVRTPVVHAAPAIAAVAPAIATHAVGVAAAPAIATHAVGVAAAPAIATHAVGVAAAPAVVDARTIGLAAHGVIGHQGLIASHGVIGHQGLIAKNVW